MSFKFKDARRCVSLLISESDHEGQGSSDEVQKATFQAEPVPALNLNSAATRRLVTLTGPAMDSHLNWLAK
jgi:hypothetical protein